MFSEHLTHSRSPAGRQARQAQDRIEANHLTIFRLDEQAQAPCPMSTGPFASSVESAPPCRAGDERDQLVVSGPVPVRIRPSPWLSTVGLRRSCPRAASQAASLLGHSSASRPPARQWRRPLCLLCRRCVASTPGERPAHQL